MDSFGNYVNHLRRQDRTPVDPYSHAYGLMTSSEKRRPQDIHRIVDREMLLGNIDNDELLRFYQMEIHSIAKLGSMAEDDPELTPFFELIHSSLRGELSITRAHKGKERERQDGFVHSGGDMAGFGSRLNYSEDEMDESDRKEKIAGLIPKLKPNKKMWM